MAISVEFFFPFGSNLVYKGKRKMLQQGIALQASLRNNWKETFLERLAQRVVVLQLRKLLEISAPK